MKPRWWEEEMDRGAKMREGGREPQAWIVHTKRRGSTQGEVPRACLGDGGAAEPTLRYERYARKNEAVF